LGIDVWVVGGDFRGPEFPSHLELVGHVVVELFGGFGDGVFDDGAGGVLVLFRAIVVDVDALVGGCLGEANGVDAGRSYALFSADERELAHDRDHRRRQGFEAEVGKPETEVELIGHECSLDLLAVLMTCPARRAHCAWGGHFVTRIPLRLALPHEVTGMRR